MVFLYFVCLRCESPFKLLSMPANIGKSSTDVWLFPSHNIIMTTLQFLPDNILRSQVCEECFQYLSVPPITVNSQGKTLCGRCFDKLTENDVEPRTYTKSSFNIVAERFSFKCTNHLNGCTKILGFSEVMPHEQTCIYKQQECFFCSFSGNLSQILNHSIKLHPENVALDGKISFFLDDKPFHKSVILILNNDQMFHVIFDLTDELFTAAVTPVTAKAHLPTVSQYGIRFFKPDDPGNIDYIHTDYGLLNNRMETYFKKGKGELVTVFGLGVKLTCEIMMEQFLLSEQEFEIRQRSAKLRQSEAQLNMFRQELQNYNSAIMMIRRMSYNLFKCSSCQKITFEKVYFCPKDHGCCKSCLTSFCVMCKSVQEFNRHENIEKFVISCGWPGCKLNILFKDYLKHKNDCLYRPYKCPLINCQEVVLSSQKLVQHWHSIFPRLTEECQIAFEKDKFIEYYWLVQNNLYHVLVNFDDTRIQVLVDEIDVLPNNISFSCEGFANSAWQQLTPSTFCGKFQINISNSVASIPSTSQPRSQQIMFSCAIQAQSNLNEPKYISLRISYN